MEAPPEMLGFEKTKMGAGEKEEGYKIGSGRLKALMIGTLIIVIGMSVMAFGYFYEIRVERKSFLKELATHDRKAAHALVATELKLWAEYQSSIHSSWSAKSVYKKIKDKYKKFPDLLKDVIAKESSDLAIPSAKGEELTEKVLQFTNLYREETLKLIEQLVNHLVEQAKDDAKQEHELSKHMKADIEHQIEQNKLFSDDESDVAASDNDPNDDEKSSTNGDGADPLAAIVDGVMARWRAEKASVSAMQHNRKLVKIKKELQRLHKELASGDDERIESAMDELSTRDWQPLPAVEQGEEEPWLEANLSKLQVDVRAMNNLEEQLAAESISTDQAIEQIMAMNAEMKLPGEWMEDFFDVPEEGLPEPGSEDET